MGNKVRRVVGVNGEDVFEIEEEVPDEKGSKKKRVKQMRVRKDKGGNEIIEEEFMNDKNVRIKVQKKAFKDEHANQVMEEVTLDEKGNRSVKRQKILKDRDGLETFVQEVIDDRGNKTITKTTKHTKDKTLIEEEKLAKNGQVYKSQKIVQMF